MSETERLYHLHKRRSYKGAPSLLDIIESLGEIDYGELIDKLVDVLEPFLTSKKYYARQHAKLTIARLCEQRLIKRKRKDGHVYYVLTTEGIARLSREQLKKYRNQREPWDGKWRLLIFDIMENKRGNRDQLRKELKGQGFVRLQNSVWVYPHECYEYTALLKTSFHLGSDVLYAIVEKLEDDETLRKKFKLIQPRS